MSETSEFLDALTASAPEDHWSYIWSLRGEGFDAVKASYWHRLGDGTAPIAERVAQVAEHSNVYFGVGTSLKQGGANQRIKAVKAAGIFALWADIDWTDATSHTKANLPPSRDAALEVLGATGLQPTITVDSGHGLQAWWVLGDYWSFDGDGDRAEAAALAEKWNATLRARAAERNWTIDSTFDLSRVMRVPGTTNFKAVDKHTGPPVPCSLLDIEPGRTYDPGDFVEYLVDHEDMGRLPSPKRTYIVGEFVLDPEAKPPQEKVDALRANHDTFGLTLDRRRTDFSDQSASSYDLSLATIAAITGWEDQEIVDLLISTRRLHGDDLKLRPDYYRRTIVRARDQSGQERARAQMSEAVDEMEDATRIGDEDDARSSRRNVFDHISSLLGMELVNAMRYTSDPPEFGVVIGAHTVHLGQIERLSGQAKFRNVVLASDVGLPTPRLKTEEWDEIVTALRKACIDIDVGREASEIGALDVWIREFLLDRPPMDSKEEAVQAQYPFLDEEGRVALFPAPFLRWVLAQRGEKVSNKNLGRVMRQIGATPGSVAVRGASGFRTSRTTWTLPAGF